MSHDTQHSRPDASPEGESLVGACDAADCAYNANRACRAGAVSIAFLNGQAVCATYSPREPVVAVADAEPDVVRDAAVPQE